MVARGLGIENTWLWAVTHKPVEGPWASPHELDGGMALQEYDVFEGAFSQAIRIYIIK